MRDLIGIIRCRYKSCKLQSGVQKSSLFWKPFDNSMQLIRFVIKPLLTYSTTCLHYK